MARNNQRGSKNNNSEGRNQYSNGVRDYARDRPIAAATVAAAAVGAGVFLWSRRSQISDQISNLSNQFGEWTDSINSGGQNRELETVGTSGQSATGGSSSSGTGSSSFQASGGSGTTGSGGRKSSKSSGMSETGGGNASLGAQSGGNGIGGNS